MLSPILDVLQISDIHLLPANIMAHLVVVQLALLSPKPSQTER